SFAHSAKEGKSADLTLVSICDFSGKKLDAAAKNYNVKFHSDFKEMLASDIDAVVLANYFHEHAPYAIQAMEAGKHVLSETIPAGTMAEAVMLCEAVEKTGMTYMFAENYPFTKIGLAMRNEYKKDKIGKVIYAEGEYIHPIEATMLNTLSPGINHWRNWMPSTYYCTHALAPLMFITDCKPVRVNALSIANDNVAKGTTRRSDPMAVMLVTMNDGSVFRITGWVTAGGHGSRFRIIGEYGTLESPMPHEGGFFGNGRLTISQNELRKRELDTYSFSYSPEWPEDAKDAEKSGHGGGDYFMTKLFVEAINSQKAPAYFDVYDGAAMSAVAILGWRSALEKGKPYDIPDFRDENARNAYRNDFATPFRGTHNHPLLQPSVNGERVPSEEDIKVSEKIWSEL
ncbi:MAG: Gfo/Idh/MocA family oxidoreductase, partial [Clostridia bacterium]|nr:Gfo/Idh/MocA family oxidoreductase [Clostridia bacterium]